MSDPDDIRRDIERTRAELSDNVNALTDSANPGNIARSKVDQVKAKAEDLKARVFGDPDNPWDDGAVGDARDRAAGAVGDVKETLTDARDSAVGTITRAPQTAKRKARGNPFAAGLVAAGLGALVGSLLPSTDMERRLAVRARDAAAPLAEEAKNMAQEAASHLQPVAQDAVDSLKESAGAAGQRLADTAASARDDVASQASDAAQTVQQQAAGAASDVKGDAQSRLSGDSQAGQSAQTAHSTVGTSTTAGSSYGSTGPAYDPGERSGDFGGESYDTSRGAYGTDPRNLPLGQDRPGDSPAF